MYCKTYTKDHGTRNFVGKNEKRRYGSKFWIDEEKTRGKGNMVIQKVSENAMKISVIN